MDPPPPLCNGNNAILHPRAYQLEMLEESLKRNIIVAMDTGSGKTNIAVLRIQAELERGTSEKLVWFLCPSLALVEQQYSVLLNQLPSFHSRFLSGNDRMDRWGQQSTWDDVLKNINIVVCTHQVLLDALVHGFVQMEKIALLVFDEAHHCSHGHPANRIMQSFYHAKKQETYRELPSILGLTASPVVSKKGGGLETIEQNLNAISKTPRTNYEELRRFVQRPEMVVLVHLDYEPSCPPLLQSLRQLYSNLDIEQDPYVVSLRSEDDERYQKVRRTRKTYCQDQIKRFVRIASEVNDEFGPWMSETYISLCIRKFQAQRQSTFSIFQSMTEEEKNYTSDLLASLPLPKFDVHLKSQDPDLSPKTRQLIELLIKEMSPRSAAIIFVKTRAAVKLLSVLLAMHPLTKDLLRIGTFVGTSNINAHASNISDLVDARDQKETLNDLRNGTKNLIIATNVCEEGVDIAVCNVVICFEPPSNLKSFIQRRGRARSTKSKYIIMFPHGKEETIREWYTLEAEMKEKYMDDMRHLEEVESLEMEEEGHREFVIESTGAKITLQDALRHLHHFCNTLPATPYTALVPIYTFDFDEEAGGVSCKVVLPNTVDSSVREFCGIGVWRTEKWARMDAAFEAYVGLYQAGLVNSNLLPFPSHDEEAAKTYAEVSTRPATTLGNSRFNPWPAVAAAWQSTSTLYCFVITIIKGDIEALRMKIISPCRLPQLLDLTLYLDAKTSLRLRFEESVETTKDGMSVTIASEITKTLLTSVFIHRMKEDEGGFPLLFVPDLEDPQSWLEQVRGTYDSNDLLHGVADPAAVGIVRDRSKSNKAYIFDGVDQTAQDCLEHSGTMTEIRLKAKKFPKRTDFLHRVHGEAMEIGNDIAYLDPKDCQIDRLPITYSQFALFIPSVMHHVESALLTDHLCNGLLAPIELSNPAVVFPALCTPTANEDSHYQRLEFLGDSILKMLTSIALMADHLTWHEGYLSHAKDHIVSNGRLAVAAQETALDQYILDQPFTGKKWRPLTNTQLETSTTSDPRKFSTKVLADVVEAVIGAAFLDGGFPKALSCLKILIPEVSWLSLAERNSILQQAVCNSPRSLTLPSNFLALETLLGHTFTCKSLLLEAVTHPSHISVPSTPSYQRLEYLGDALLDYVVTTTIFSHEDPSKAALQPQNMHTLRSTAVNASFLAFCSLSRTVSTSVAEIVHTDAREVPLIVPGSRSLSLSKFLRHAPIPALVSALGATRTRFAVLESIINAALSQGIVYPWRAFAAFAPEKVFSDMIEAVLGAVYIDTGGDLGACDALVRRFGIIDWVETALENEIQLLHPKEEVGHLAVNDSVKYRVWIEDDDCIAPIRGEGEGAGKEKLDLGTGSYRCQFFVGEQEICCVQGWNRVDVETAAAEEAVRVLKARGSDASDSPHTRTSPDPSTKAGKRPRVASGEVESRDFGLRARRSDARDAPHVSSRDQSAKAGEVETYGGEGETRDFGLRARRSSDRLRSTQNR